MLTAGSLASLMFHAMAAFSMIFCNAMVRVVSWEVRQRKRGKVYRRGACHRAVHECMMMPAQLVARALHR